MKKQEAKRIISDIQPEEVSLVGSPANREKFLIVKGVDGSTSISIESDGTTKGTVLKVNGKVIRNCAGLYFATGFEQEKAECSYSVNSKNKEGFTEFKSYYLEKSKETIMDKNILAELQKFTGEEIDVEKMDLTDAIENIQKAMEMVNEFKEDLPDDLAKAVGVLAKHAAVNCTEDVEVMKEEEKVEKKEDATDVDPEKQEIEKEEVQKEDAQAEAIEKMTDAVTKVGEAMEQLSKRLEVVEKSTGGRKSIDSQDVEKQSGTAFPSMDTIPNGRPQ